MRYRAIDLVRRDDMHHTQRAAEAGLDAGAGSDDVCDTAVKRDDARRLHAWLTMLPDAQQEVITLAFYGQLSHTEIASHLGLPSSTIKGRMRLGLQKLRANLDQAAA